MIFDDFDDLLGSHTEKLKKYIRKGKNLLIHKKVPKIPEKSDILFLLSYLPP